MLSHTQVNSDRYLLPYSAVLSVGSAVLSVGSAVLSVGSTVLSVVMICWLLYCCVVFCSAVLSVGVVLSLLCCVL